MSHRDRQRYSHITSHACEHEETGRHAPSDSSVCIFRFLIYMSHKYIWPITHGITRHSCQRQKKKTSIIPFYTIYTVYIYIMDVIQIWTDNVFKTDMNRIHFLIFIFLSPHPTDVDLVIIYWSLALCVTWLYSGNWGTAVYFHLDLVMEVVLLIFLIQLYNVTKWATMAHFLSILFHFLSLTLQTNFTFIWTCCLYVHNHAIYSSPMQFGLVLSHC